MDTSTQSSDSRPKPTIHFYRIGDSTWKRNITMPESLSLNELHDLIQFDVENPTVNLEVTVTTDPPQPRRTLTSTATTSRGQASFTHEGAAVTLLASLLQSYPVPATVNGKPVKRRPALHGPAVSRIIRRRDQNLPDRDILLTTIPHPETVVTPRITCDGLTYRHVKIEQTKMFHTPNPQQNNLPWIPAHLNRLNHHIAIVTNAQNRGDYDFTRARSSAEVIFNHRAAERLRRIITAQRDQAAQIAGHEGDWKSLSQLPKHTTWGFQVVFLKPPSLPVTIELPARHYHADNPSHARFQRPESPTAHTVHHALLHNPNNHLAPVMPPMHTTTPHLSNAELASITVTYDDGFTIEATQTEAMAISQLPAARAADITARIQLYHHDGSTSELDLPSDFAMLGDYTNEQPVVTHRYPDNPKALAAAMSAAYFHPKPGQPGYEDPHDMESCQHIDHQEQHQAAMLTLAIRILHTVPKRHYTTRYAVTGTNSIQPPKCRQTQTSLPSSPKL